VHFFFRACALFYGQDQSHAIMQPFVKSQNSCWCLAIFNAFHFQQASVPSFRSHSLPHIARLHCRPFSSDLHRVKDASLRKPPNIWTATTSRPLVHQVAATSIRAHPPRTDQCSTTCTHTRLSSCLQRRRGRGQLCTSPRMPTALCVPCTIAVRLVMQVFAQLHMSGARTLDWSFCASPADDHQAEGYG
jgi:hypothetical protein